MKIKDLIYGVKPLKLKHLTNGYIRGGTFITIAGNGKNDKDRVICSGRKCDLMKLPYWNKLRNKKIIMLYSKWDGKDGLIILLDASNEVNK